MIRILEPRLANQIAAGEVVERPSSVVKEAVENSLDALATRIDIDVEAGGTRLLRIRDNGVGMGESDLALSMARHATSKIDSIEDLEAVASLGFRGEALASIASVSRLVFTSNTREDSAHGQQALCEGREMSISVRPAPHPRGTTLEVRDLFYNTPARRKFLRTEKTEFGHVHEVIKRQALSRPDVAFTVRHNGKQTLQLNAAMTETERNRRIAAICSREFAEHTVPVERQAGPLRLWGWVAEPTFSRSQADLQYFFVNYRLQQCAADFFIVLTIAKLTVAKIGSEINKAINNLVLTQMGQSKFPNTRGVYYLAAANQVEKSRCCGGVSTFLFVFRQWAYLHIGIRKQLIQQ